MSAIRRRTRPRRERRALLAAFLGLALFPVPAPSPAQANPFTSGGAAAGPAPVRTSRPDERVALLQARMRDAIAGYFFDWKESRSPGVLWSVLGVAFAYGFIHAAGPGHRKTVVFSLYLAKRSHALEPLGIGILLSILHAGTSIVLMLALRGAAGSISGRSAELSLLMEGISYSILVLMSLGLLIRAAIGLSGKKAEGPKAMGTGALLLSGIYPCPGAILILVLALSLGMLGLGIAAVGAMSLGMSLPVIASGYLAWLGRTGLFSRLKAKEGRIALVSGIVEICGYSVLFLFSLFIAWPFLMSLFR